MQKFRWAVKPLLRYWDFRGRSPRREYWMFWTLTTAVALLIYVFEDAFDYRRIIGPYGLFSIAFTLMVAVPTISLAVRRLHDCGRTGHWLWLGLVPLFGWFVLWVLLSRRGNAQGRKFGPDPRAEAHMCTNPGNLPLEHNQGDGADTVHNRRESMAEPNTPRNRGDSDAPHASPVTPAEDLRTVAINQISWSAVFAGVAVALIAQLLLNMLGLGLGMATLDPGTADNPNASTFSIGAAVWWTLSGIIAAFLGGWIAGRTAGKPKESTGGWHGLVTWAVTSLIVIYLVSSAVSSVVGGAMSALSGAARTAGNAASTAATAAGPAAAQPGAMSGVMEQVQSATGIENPGAVASAAVGAAQATTSGDPQQAAQAREQAAQTLAREQGIPLPQARQQVAQQQQQATQTAGQVKQQATKAADTAATAVSAAALLAAISLLLGALGAWFGGRRGAPHPTLTANLPR
jgi:uncharacterized membrane protein YhaH (DUF805 family)